MVDFEKLVKNPCRPRTLITVPALKVLPQDIIEGRAARDNPEKRHVKMAFEVQDRGGRKWIHVVDGGATGHESISLDSLREAVRSDIDEGVERPWSACFGSRTYPQIDVEHAALAYLLKAADAVVRAGLETVR